MSILHSISKVRLTIAAAIVMSVVGAGVSLPVQAAPKLPGPSALMRTVDAYSQLGPDHLTGTATEAKTQRWFAQQLRSAGVHVGDNAYTFLGFRPRTVSLRVAGERRITKVAAYFYSGVTSARGRAATLVDAGYGSQAEVAAAHVAGKIAVVEVPEVDEVGATFANAFSAVEAAGAVGMVAVTDGPGDYPVQQDVDSRSGVQKLPTLLVGARTGKAVIAAAKASDTATLTLDAAVGSSCDTDVWGVLPGRDPDRYEIVGTPTSGFDRAASERGAGVAAELALARHYAALPISQRPVSLVFAGLSGHEVGYLGLPVLMQTHPNWFDMADAYIHLGASIAAVAQVQAPDGTVSRLPAGDPSRSLYISENPLLHSVADKAFAGAQPLGNTPPSVTDPGEQSEAYAAGIPIVSESGSSLYFHTAGDRPSGVSASLLTGQTTAFENTINGIAALPAGDVRSANVVPGEADKLAGADTTPSGKAGPATYEPQPVASCANRKPTQPPDDASPAVAASDLPIGLGQLGGFESNQPAYAWQGNWQQRAVTWTSSATGAQLYGVEFAPHRLPARRDPGVVIVPGSGPGVQSFYQWSARDLAGHGYIALVVDPQGVGESGALGHPVCKGSTDPGNATPCPGVPFQQNANYVDAAESGVNFLVSKADPYRGVLDTAEIGLAGHSLGARAVSYVQGVDKRVKAVVAWDNLASDLNGDAGSASGGPPASEVTGGGVPGAPAQPVTPRVPSLGEASDSQGFQTDNSTQIKKTAYDRWVGAHIPSMEVVYGGASHDDWAQSSTDGASEQTSLYRFEWYTRAWFDVFLSHDRSAESRLTTRSIDGTAVSSIVSKKYLSAMYLPSYGVNCPDLVAKSCP